MKYLFNETYKIKISVLILIVLTILTIILSIIYFNFEIDEKLGSIIAGLVSGIMVAIIQLIIAWKEYKTYEKVKDLDIKQVLINRDDRIYYENYLRSARKCIDIMGVTGYRFMEHFANDDENAPENAKILFQLMSRGVSVRILITHSSCLLSNEDRRNEQNVRSRYERATQRYPTKFNIRYFEHVAAHSIFRVDDECIIGPVFPNVSSKFTPGLHLKTKSPFAEKYLDYFENEWQNGKTI